MKVAKYINKFMCSVFAFNLFIRNKYLLLRVFSGHKHCIPIQYFSQYALNNLHGNTSLYLCVSNFFLSNKTTEIKCASSGVCAMLHTKIDTHRVRVFRHLNFVSLEQTCISVAYRL